MPRMVKFIVPTHIRDCFVFYVQYSICCVKSLITSLTNLNIFLPQLKSLPTLCERSKFTSNIHRIVLLLNVVALYYVQPISYMFRIVLYFYPRFNFTVCSKCNYLYRLIIFLYVGKFFIVLFVPKTV